MKKLLLPIFISLSIATIGQGKNIVVKAQKQTITTSLDSDNSTKTVIINGDSKTVKTDKLVIYNGNYLSDKDWKRTFTIFDETDAEILRLPMASKERYYEVALKDLQTRLQKDKDYSLYTMAIPKDSRRAATVRVRRILICKIRMK